jgi:cytochrome P450
VSATQPVNITTRAFKANAHASYAHWRVNDPICRVLIGANMPALLVTKYNDVSRLLKDARFVKDPANALTPEQLAKQPTPPRFFQPLLRNMLGLDDPDHARLKRLVQAGFTPRRMEGLVAQTELVVDKLIFEVSKKSHFDIMADFALPLPVTIISELLGVPEADRERFARWSHTLLSANITSWRMVLSLPDLVQFMFYLRKLVALKRREPQNDLVSALVALESEGEHLSGDELLAMISILLSAGHETTTNLIGNGLVALLNSPDHFAQLRDTPSITNSAVEELLRFASPLETSTIRYANADLEFGGVQIAKGDIVMGGINSANRDEAQFSNPSQLDFSRSPNRHLAFGEGGHYCVGAALARMEGQVAFKALLKAKPNLRFDQDPDDLPWRPGMVLRGLTHLRLRSN